MAAAGLPDIVQLIVNISHYKMPYRNMKFSSGRVNLRV